MESIASWGAPVATTIAALMTASNLGSRITGWGFFVFLIGSILWGLLGHLTDQPNLVWQNVVLAALNILGMWRWLGRQARIEEGGEAAHDKSARAASETLFPASLLTRAELRGRDGAALGHAVDAMVGCGSGRIAYVVIGEGGVAGLGERFRRLPWDGLHVEGDALRTGRSSLDGLDALEKDNWPAR